MKKILLASTVFILYAAACVFILSRYWYQENESTKTQTTPTEVNLKVLKEQAKMRKQDSLNRLEELQMAQEIFLDTIKSAPAISQSDRIEALTASNLEDTYVPALFNVTDLNGNVKFTCNDYATIYLNSSKVKIPVQCKNYGLAIKQILAANTSAKLLIIGSSSTGESASLGKSRANFIKDLLASIAINTAQLQVASRVENISYTYGAVSGGIKMVLIEEGTTISETATANSSTSQTKGENADPFKYKKFTTGFNGDFYYGDQLATSYIVSLKNFLNANTLKNVTILSYTDAVGSDLDNMELSKQNANMFKKLMLEAGIPGSRIMSLPQGSAPKTVNNGKRCMIITVK